MAARARSEAETPPDAQVGGHILRSPTLSDAGRLRKSISSLLFPGRTTSSAQLLEALLPTPLFEGPGELSALGLAALAGLGVVATHSLRLFLRETADRLAHFSSAAAGAGGGSSAKATGVVESTPFGVE